jgi:hypothetical protein
MMRVKTFNSLTWALVLAPRLAQALAGPAAQDGPQPRLQTIELTAGMHVIRAELAITPAQQATGMMFRTEMPGNEGMLFVNDEPARAASGCATR